jgi:hypothetical protein
VEIAKEVKVQWMQPGAELESWIKKWKEDAEAHRYISIPFFFVYFLWWARNNAIFQNNFIPCEVVAGMTIKLVWEYKVRDETKEGQKTFNASDHRHNPLGFFDGASQGHPPLCLTSLWASIQICSSCKSYKALVTHRWWSTG